MSEQHIIRRSLNEKRRGRTDWERLQAMSEEEIEENAATDADNPPWTQEELANAELIMPGDEPKIPVSIRLDPEVLDHFKLGGRGYQTRISAVLLAYVRSRARKKP